LLCFQVNAGEGDDDVVGVTLSGAGLTARGKSSPVLEAQEHEPMHVQAKYSSGLARAMQ
jgi:hypothetical protein